MEPQLLPGHACIIKGDFHPTLHSCCEFCFTVHNHGSKSNAGSDCHTCPPLPSLLSLLPTLQSYYSLRKAVCRFWIRWCFPCIPEFSMKSCSLRVQSHHVASNSCLSVPSWRAPITSLGKFWNSGPDFFHFQEVIGAIQKDGILLAATYTTIGGWSSTDPHADPSCWTQRSLPSYL